MSEVDDLIVVHVRRPGLPWRREHPKTECGLPSDGHSVITREEFVVKLKREGERRARYSTCQTCLDTAQRWPSWEEDPVRCLYREADHRWRQKEPTVFHQELLALAVLAQRHDEEFRELLEDQRLIVRLPALRGRAQ